MPCRFADRTGRCFPSVRTLAKATGTPRSTVSRHLAQFAEDGVIARQRRPGGVYAYTIARRFLPAARGVSHRREKGVPPARTEEHQVRKQGTRERDSPDQEVSFGEIPDDRAKWQARLRRGGNRGSGCRCGVRSRPSRGALRRGRCSQRAADCIRVVVAAILCRSPRTASRTAPLKR